MSKSVSSKRMTPPEITALKNDRPIVALTAYSAPMASIIDPHVDILLVGDSMGMVLYGMDSTLGVSVEMMSAHTVAVCKSSSHACVVADLPFGSYQQSKEQAFETAAKIMEESGCAAVKLEGGSEMSETIEFLNKRAIPVMAHIGLMPQHVNSHGGYRYQGRNDSERRKIMDDARQIANAGAFSVVMECMDQQLAAEITDNIDIPTIGIGAGKSCDGQILVTEDMLGMFENNAKFVKQYAKIRQSISEAAVEYAKEVRERQYPKKPHSFGGDW